MKRIVVCCDGTWNRADARHPSNALRLARAVEPQGPDGTVQIVCHLDGVGSGRGTGWLSRLTDKALGGAMGLGLAENVAEAYRFLVFNYAPGDSIYLFGYSRGAFTARSLVGLIRNCGILERDRIVLLPKAIRLYRQRGDASHPNGDRARKFRARNAVGGMEFFPDLAYLGVWETVGALGVPEHMILARMLNRGFEFHDTRLTAKVAAARHAVAIDERRRTFQPALWDNLDELNASDPTVPYRQVWFPGNHGCVGGGASLPLSNDALYWIACGAENAGLALCPETLSSWLGNRDAYAPLPPAGGALQRLVAMGYTDRSGPASIGDLAHAGLERWRHDASYRPGALRLLTDLLDSRDLSGPD
jgi:uncharacterized protein (DUF2235 family)